MKSFVLVAVLAAVASAAVQDLTDANFESTLKNQEVALVKFTAPWCGHCKSLKPEFEAASEVLSKEGIMMVDVDATIHTTIAGKYQVQGYPSIKIFREGVATDYNGPRQKEGIIKYMRAQKEPVKALTSVAALDELTSSGGVALIGVFQTKESEGYSAFKKFALANNDKIRFAEAVAQPEVATKLGETNTVYLYRKMRTQSKKEASLIPSKGSALTEASHFVDFIAANLPQIVFDNGDLDIVRPKLTGKTQVTLHVSFDPENDPAQVTYLSNRLRKVVADYSKFVFLVGKGNPQNLERFGVSGRFDVVLTASQNDKRYKMEDAPFVDGKINADKIVAFLKALEAGTLEAFIKSEEPPAQDGAVRHLVAKDFSQALAEDMDHFIMFHAPWCGHCKSMKPDWEKFAEAAKTGSKNLRVAMFDATANDVPADYQVSGFPTLFFVPAGGSPIKYEGGRDMKSWIEFAKKSSKHSVHVEL